MVTLTEKEFESLLSFIKVNYGNDLTNNRTFVELRISRLMAEGGYDSFAEYFSYVCSDMTGVAISNMISSLTINHTLFNREPNHFRFLAEEVLPALKKQEEYSHDIRIWCAGCATGEEPYTLAMILADFFGVYKPYWDTRILACDISMTALKKALTGVYPVDGIKNLEPGWVDRYFEKYPEDPGFISVSEKIRNEVIFKRMNLVGDTFNFKRKFHCIFCRNVMIYFDDETKDKVVQKFCECLEPGGYLFIGTTESLQKGRSDLKYVMPSVYQKQ